MPRGKRLLRTIEGNARGGLSLYLRSSEQAAFVSQSNLIEVHSIALIELVRAGQADFRRGGIDLNSPLKGEGAPASSPTESGLIHPAQLERLIGFLELGQGVARLRMLLQRLVTFKVDLAGQCLA